MSSNENCDAFAILEIETPGAPGSKNSTQRYYVYLDLSELNSRIRAKCVEKPDMEVALHIALAAQIKVKNIVKELINISQFRSQNLGANPMYVRTTNVREQLKFLKKVDEEEQIRNDEKVLKELNSGKRERSDETKAIEQRAMQQARKVALEIQQRAANATALLALGPPKKRKLNGPVTEVGSKEAVGVASSVDDEMPSTSGRTEYRPITWITFRDMLFFMENDPEYKRSTLLYSAYLK